MKQVSSLLATFALLLVAVAVPANLHAQTFEGVVEYSITTEEGTMPMTYMSKGDNVRVEMEGRPGMKAVILMDTKQNKATMLMEQMKMYMEMPEPQSSDEEAAKPEITKTGKTQKILGYECQEFIVKEGDEVTDVWVTKDLGKFQMFRMGGPGAKKEADEWQKVIGSENGFPLLATTKEGDEQISKMVATKVEKKSLDDALFKIPEGFKAMDASMMRRPGQ
jgi:hypothetical protein